MSDFSARAVIVPSPPLPRSTATWARTGRLLGVALWTIAAALAASSCIGRDPTSPQPTVALTLCLSDQWAAYQNDGGEWTRLLPLAGRHSFAATERLALAEARLDAASPYLRISYLSAEQALRLYGCNDPAQPIPRGFKGVVLGLTDGDFGLVSFGSQAVSSSMATVDHPMVALPWRETEADLLATRMEMPGVATRVIARRGQRYPPDTTVTIDFLSTEAFAPAAHTLRWTGGRSHVQVNFRTATGSEITLQSVTYGEMGDETGTITTTALSLPTSQQESGDRYHLMLGSTGRTLDLYHATPRDLHLSLGPPAPLPAFTQVATSPYRRVRIDIPSQPGYGAEVTVFLQQSPSDGAAGVASVSITATREYFGGTPPNWSLMVPDLGSLSGFSPIVGLVSGEYRWTLWVTGRPSDFRETHVRGEQQFFSATGYGRGTLR